MNQDPRAPATDVRPVRLIVGGVEYGPIRVAGEGRRRDARVAGGANAVAARRLRGVEGFDALKESLEKHIGATFVSAPHGRGDRWIRLAHGQGGERLERATDPAGPWRAILAVDAYSEPGRHGVTRLAVSVAGRPFCRLRHLRWRR